MRAVAAVLLVTWSAIFIAITPASAHHAIAAKFDTTKAVTLSGVVTEVDWANPHVHVFMRAQDASKAVWAVELESVVDLLKNGWSSTTVKPGDAITVQGMTARNGSKQAWGKSVTLTSTGKGVLTGVNPAQPPAPRSTAAAGPTPRWPDGKPRLGPAPGATGYWANPSSTVLSQSGANVQIDSDGLLRNIADVDKVAPFQKWARDLYEYRQRNFLKDDPMFQTCKPPGGPRQFQLPYGTQFIEDKEHQRIFVFLGNGNRNYRIIYTDGRSQVGQVIGDADNPLYYGRAVAHWEGDTLVIDTKGFNEKFWMTNGGLPHTEQLHLIERLTRTNANTLKYEVTVDDPGAYTKPWSNGWTLQWNPDEELPIYYCQDNRP